MQRAPRGNLLFSLKGSDHEIEILASSRDHRPRREIMLAVSHYMGPLFKSGDRGHGGDFSLIHVGHKLVTCFSSSALYELRMHAVKLRFSGRYSPPVIKTAAFF